METPNLVAEGVDMNVSKALIPIGAGVGALIAYIGSWSVNVEFLVILMAIDFLFGILMPLFLGKSKKAETEGKLESRVCRRGIVKKCVIFLMIYVSFLLSKVVHFDFLPDAVTTAFIIAEVVSILEHAALLGVPIPNVLVRAIKVVNDNMSRTVDSMASGTSEVKNVDLDSVKKSVITTKADKDSEKQSL